MWYVFLRYGLPSTPLASLLRETGFSALCLGKTELISDKGRQFSLYFTIFAPVF